MEMMILLWGSMRKKDQAHPILSPSECGYQASVGLRKRKGNREAGDTDKTWKTHQTGSEGPILLPFGVGQPGLTQAAWSTDAYAGYGQKVPRFGGLRDRKGGAGGLETVGEAHGFVFPLYPCNPERMLHQGGRVLPPRRGGPERSR